MKRIVFLAMVMVLLITGHSFAAGSWSGENDIDKGWLDNAPGSVVGLPRTATSDASAATVPAWPYAADSAMANVAGCMVGYVLQFDATTPPTSVVAVFKDKYGLILNPDTDDTVNTGSVRVKFDTPECIAGGLYATFTVVGNSKIFKAIPIFLR